MRSRTVLWLKIGVHAAALAPLAALILAFWQNSLGLDPIGELTWRTGRFALAFLMLSLAPTAIATVSGFRAVLRIRRALGLYAFLYACLHFLIFVWLDYRFDVEFIVQAIQEGPFVLIGLSALIILVPLAVTSTKGWMRRLGRNWKRLHRLAYLSAGLAALHYTWRFKELRLVPLLVGAGLMLLLVLRVPWVARSLVRPRGT